MKLNKDNKALPRLGNNRRKVKKQKARRLRAIALASRRENRS